MSSSSESPPLPRSPAFYRFRSYSSIKPLDIQSTSAQHHQILPHILKRIMRSVAAVILPIILLPFHYCLLLLAMLTTILSMVFLSLRAFGVYLEITMKTLSQVYADFAMPGRRSRRRKRDLLIRVVLEREEAARTEPIRSRGRGFTIA
jgi:hypothetical protein